MVAAGGSVWYCGAHNGLTMQITVNPRGAGPGRACHDGRSSKQIWDSLKSERLGPLPSRSRPTRESESTIHQAMVESKILEMDDSARETAPPETEKPDSKDKGKTWPRPCNGIFNNQAFRDRVKKARKECGSILEEQTKCPGKGGAKQLSM